MVTQASRVHVCEGRTPAATSMRTQSNPGVWSSSELLVREGPPPAQQAARTHTTFQQASTPPRDLPPPPVDSPILEQLGKTLRGSVWAHK